MNTRPAGLWIWLLAFGFVLCFSTPAMAQKGKRKTLPSKKFKGYGLPAAVKQRPSGEESVARVSAGREKDCRDAAAKIDALVEAELRAQGLKPNGPAQQDVFLRRAYLDAVGTIPTLPQTLDYLQDKNPAKQTKLIDDLLNSYGYVSHMYNFWASILRIKDRPQNNTLAFSYGEWVKEQLRQNRPYDAWVHEMLTAEGKIWESPAAGYTLRDNGMPLVHVDNTVRVFLGTQIGCAQCHDHPFDRWTQKEFYQLAALSHGTRTRDAKGTPAFENGNPINRLKEEYKGLSGESRLPGTANLLAQANLTRVSFDPKRVLKLPHDYQYSDGKPNQKVKPKVLWGEIPNPVADMSTREQYAAWLTSPDNPLFAKTIANRLWKKVMGVGLIEPIDDIRDDSPCQNAALLEFLSAEMVRLKFDQKEFIRTLMYTQTYQRASSDFDPSESEFYHYPGPRLRRMSPEQIWDSILTIAIYDPMSFELPGNEEFAAVVDVDLATIDVASLVDLGEEYNQAVGPPARNKLMNSTAAYRRQVLARASELPSPLPTDHFLRQFGQGDRETIEGYSLDPTVPQILTMFNGPFTHMMLEKGSVIYDSLTQCRTSQQALEVMFLSILNRKPTSRDKDIGLRELARGDRAMGYGNVVWALINTREFMFVQ